MLLDILAGFSVSSDNTSFILDDFFLGIFKLFLTGRIRIDFFRVLALSLDFILSMYFGRYDILANPPVASSM